MGRLPPKSRPEREPGLAARALRLLARREHTRRELAAKLAPHSDDPGALDALLDEFVARGWLSEARAVDQLVSAKRGRFGAARIRHELERRGVSDEAMAGALDALKPSELERASAVHHRKFPDPAGDASDVARRIRFLQSRGFSVETALRVVRGARPDPGE